MKPLAYINTSLLMRHLMRLSVMPAERSSKAMPRIRNLEFIRAELAGKSVELKGGIQGMLKWLSMATGPITTDGNRGYLHQPPIDRTGTIEQPFDFSFSPYPMPVLSANDKTFEEVCLEEAAEITANADKHGGKKIVVAWSGGVDSTCILAAFIRYMGMTGAASRVIVCMNEFSIKENPRFYREIIVKHGFQVVSSDGYYDTFAEQFKDHVIVNGDPGGALEGGGALRNLVARGEDISIPNWKDQIRPVYRDIFNVAGLDDILPERRLYENFLESIQASAAFAGVEIKNSFDCMWWYLFNFKWQAMSLNFHRTCERLFLENPRPQAVWKEMFVPFFASPRFQLWSYSNKDRILHARMNEPWPAHYKKAFKEFIFSVDGDSEYRDNKGKEAALYSMVKDRGPQMFALDLNFNPIFFDWTAK